MSGEGRANRKRLASVDVWQEPGPGGGITIEGYARREHPQGTHWRYKSTRADPFAAGAAAAASFRDWSHANNQSAWPTAKVLFAEAQGLSAEDLATVFERFARAATDDQIAGLFAGLIEGAGQLAIVSAMDVAIDSSEKRTRSEIN